MTPVEVAAVDLGATSGRVIVGKVGGGELSMRTLGRFENRAVPTPNGLHWDMLGLYRGALTGLAAAVREHPSIASIGVDSWAVDYALFGGGRMLGTPYHYRDARTAAGVEAAHALVPFAELYRRNGLQFLPFNTLYQLAAERAEGPLLGLADALLLVPDLFGYFLTGNAVAERTNASTTGLVDVSTGQWDDGLIELLGLPRGIFPGLVDPGERIGATLPYVQREIGADRPIDVVAVGSHDTASAVVGIPMQDASRAAYISCGTWGLVGLELEHPVTSDAAREANFTNEGGVDGRVRFLHNVMGLWLLSESVRQWELESGSAIDLPTLIAEAGAITTPVAVFDPDDARFAAPGDLPARIAEWCREHGEPVPASWAEFTRSIIESLAEAFAKTVQTAAELTGRDVDVIHLVGGGSLNTLLCRRTADRSGIPVLAGPVEATAIGNVLVQARAQGATGASLEELRAIVATAFPPLRYDPRASSVE
ncbi:rhamnulokinase [Agromyces seonyuensis]|uniref:Rhamnulokinase n=1 Tax=Agromyces seonyuensis TaxID=2662446 RepID=A0A6I4P1M2_9MICO|nr:rhamnulokinase family protein [Agromyces seonyuensis]MWB97127.1 rhamnulokinase [Agromyces seonyuensis]